MKVSFNNNNLTWDVWKNVQCENELWVCKNHSQVLSWAVTIYWLTKGRVSVWLCECSWGECPYPNVPCPTGEEVRGTWFLWVMGHRLLDEEAPSLDQRLISSLMSGWNKTSVLHVGGPPLWLTSASCIHRKIPLLDHSPHSMFHLPARLMGHHSVPCMPSFRTTPRLKS